MAGILASSASKVMVSGDAAEDKSVTGFVTGERIVLTTTPAGTAYSWGLSVPAESAVARSKLDDKTDASPTFVPDVDGVYVIAVTVDVASYVLRLTVRSVAISTPIEVLRLSPIADAQVPTPSIERAIYFSSDQNAVVEKRPDGSVHPFTTA